MFPFSTLFSFTLVTSVVMALSASQWLFIWMALELNLLSFIPLMFKKFSSQETEAAIKYFLIQALGSSLLLMSSNSIFMTHNTPFILSVSSLIMMVSVMMKLGMAPFHYWFPNVMSSLSWEMCLILSTWQKIIPMVVLLMKISVMDKMILFLVISISSVVGGLGGLNQTQLRPLLAYSSIGHMSWMVAASVFSLSISLIYLIVYIIISVPLMILLKKSSLFSSNMNSSVFSMLNTIWIFFLLFSLSGMPPFLGFIPKLLVLMSMQQLSMLALILILGSLINLFYYLNIITSLLMKSSNYQILGFQNNNAILMPIVASLSSIFMSVFIYAMTMLNQP